MAVQQAASARCIPVALELGGNDPAYIRPDVDVAWAAENIVDGCVFNSGQSCCAVERVYVHADIYDAFVNEVVKVVEGYKLGDPNDAEIMVGPVVSKAAAERIKEDVQDAVDKGARRVTPAGVNEYAEKQGGAWSPIEILADCNHTMRKLYPPSHPPLSILTHSRYNDHRNIRPDNPHPTRHLRRRGDLVDERLRPGSHRQHLDGRSKERSGNVEGGGSRDGLSEQV